jgi:hypothetical protein
MSPNRPGIVVEFAVAFDVEIALHARHGKNISKLWAARFIESEFVQPSKFFASNKLVIASECLLLAQSGHVSCANGCLL